MGTELRAITRVSNSVTLKSTLNSESESWFARACVQILPKDPGFALSITTGFPSSTCYRYAAEGLPQGGNFVRALLRSEQGRTWLNVIMDDCTTAWWVEHQALQAQADKLVRIRHLIGE